MNPVFRKLLLAGIASAALLSGASFAADKLPVIASFSILGDLVRVVGGERVSVTTLVGPDEDAHVFEPRPADVKAIAQTRLLVTNGLGFEPWAQKIVKSAGYQGQSVVASQGVKPRQLQAEKGHQHAETDPHAWQDPGNVVLYVRNITAALTKVDPTGASVYQANSDAYVKELQTLDAWAKSQFAALPPAKRQVITSHDAFGYFGAHYQIKFLAPQGMSTEMEPSAKDVARLIQQIQREKIKAVFIENMSAPKLLAQLSKDAGVTVGPTLFVDALSTPQGPAGSYLQLMRHNVTQLAAGMKLN
ncbi:MULTISPECIES: metal ABC transporter substrate-binding protein [unclassified Polaromonas]|uniref:metal ABC transporter substrate-binding protein n=1 Tax=unclassified Polaromonas TaxID=2638319 RepID=UPI0018CBACA0|nr:MULTISPECIES: metal ABC transporter substrate-binding protein [unclassified Polaromonas]MBG6071262.1 zinc/manganese transport system substrate-binding protein [Polaromonas sp. CG_9.7]MBG6113262.1 zinc/manganese transport system substrate-binding protein [Polaromonas sp. CG_9.2]MDH6185797.1 zinc/manganese transport system substrate-binding protein [Polaromonas sp. CG_23.6]